MDASSKENRLDQSSGSLSALSPLVLRAHLVTYYWNKSFLEKNPLKPVRPALNQFSLTLSRGEFLTLLGPNGSGKSTLLKAMAGLLPQSIHSFQGEIFYRDQSFLSLPPLLRAQRVAYVSSQGRVDFPMTVEEVVSLGQTPWRAHSVFSRKKDYTHLEWALRECHCEELRKRSFSQLSGGERQRVFLAQGLMQRAKVLLLDETLSQMDLDYQILMGEMLQRRAKEGYSIVLVAHDLNLAVAWATTAILIKEGRKLAQGAVRDVVTEENLRLLYPEAGLILRKHPTQGTPQVFLKS